MSETFVFVGDVAVGDPLTHQLVKAGFVAADSLSSADVIITYCQTLTDLEDVYFDTEGVIQSAKKGAYTLDLSAATPGFARELNAVATVSEIHAVEAPVIVKNIAHKDAFGDKDNLFCYVAGEESHYETVKPFLEVMVGSHEYLESVGSGQLAKAMNTLQSVSLLVSLIEADALYRAANLPNDKLQKVYEGNLVSSRARQLYEAIKVQSFSGSYTVQMCTAELSAALMAADDAELILPSAEAAMHLFELLVVIGGADMAPVTLSLIYGDEENCAKHGLDWTRAEQAYSQDQLGHYDDEDYDAPDEYSNGFGSFSSN